MKIRVNYHGLVAIVFITIMVVGLLFQQFRLPIVIHAVISIIAYSAIVYVVTSRQERQLQDKRYIVSESTQLLQLRLLFGAHLAMIFLLVGVFIPLSLVLRVVYFVVAVAFAMLVPFVVITSHTDEN
jgi:hypothetical protein